MVDLDAAQSLGASEFDSVALARDWAEHVREAARRILIREGAVLGVGLIIALVVDVALLRGTEALDHILTGLPAQAVICLVGAAMLEWVPRVRAHPHAFGLLGYVVVASSAGYVLGELGGMDGPFFYLAYLLPCVVIGLPGSLPTRCAFTAAILGSFIGTFAAMRPGNLAHQFAHIAWVHLTLISSAFIYFGHALHETSRERFVLAAVARRQAALLEHDNRTLADVVHVKERDLVAATDRAAHVRWEERTHLARALHDDLGQLLISARVHLHDLERALEGVRHEDRVEQLRSVIQDIESSARGIVTGYRESDVPFEVAVEDLVESFRSLERVEVELDLRCQEWEPGPHVRDVCIRTIQEGLNNVLKHAQATRADVSVVRNGNEVRVRVSDDGAGILETSAGDGVGLRGMHERAESIGGRVAISTAEGGGTMVEVTLPVLSDRLDDDAGRLV
ncbi:MAG: sensor histidine kinase [Sandaracinaceae bacterium]|nr:sensor histidine kinase [Sandaracinaceae bacterium]